MVRNKDLDAEALYHCQNHTNLLVEDTDLGVLWDEYGIVGDLMVMFFISEWQHFVKPLHPALHQ